MIKLVEYKFTVDIELKDRRVKNKDYFVFATSEEEANDGLKVCLDCDEKIINWHNIKLISTEINESNIKFINDYKEKGPFTFYDPL